MGEIDFRHLERLEPFFVRVSASTTIGAIRPLLEPDVRWIVVEFESHWALAEAAMIKRSHLDDALTRPISLFPQILTPALTLERTAQGVGEARWRAWRLRDRVLVVVDEGRFAGLIGDPEHSMTRGSETELTEARFLRAKVEAGSPPELRTQSFAPDQPHTLTLSIGPSAAGLLVAETPVPPESTTTAQMLNVSVVAPWTTVQGQMFLPAVGASSDCVLDLGTPLPGPQRVMVVVMSETGIVQTATLIGETTNEEPEAPLALLVDASLWPNHSPAMPTLVSDSGQVAAALPSDEGFDLAGVGDLEQASIQLHEDLDFALQGLWLDEFGLDDDETIDVLRKMARSGVALHDDLFERLPPVLRDEFAGAGPIQLIVRDPKLDIPAELFYDLPTPDASSSALCPGATEALTTGVCSHCADNASTAHICPMGFWGLRRVIERRVIDPDLSGSQPLRIASTADAPHAELPVLDSALVAQSARVEQERSKTLFDALTASNIRCAVADDWTEWSQVVTGESPPGLLIAMPHVDQAGSEPRMEIGDTELERVDISAQYIRHPPVGPDEPGPVVLLLGCETAAAPVAHRTMTSRFFGQGASIVLGTRMPVIADAAPLIGAALIRSLSSQRDAPFGEAVLQARRELFADGQLIALALVALGDGGWRLAA